MQPGDQYDLGDFVRINSNACPLEAGSVCEITHLLKSKTTKQVQVHLLSTKSWAKEPNCGPNNIPIEHLTLLTREESADVFDKRADALDAMVSSIVASAEKHRYKARILRKYKNPKSEIAAEFHNAVIGEPDKDKRLAALQKVLAGRVKETLVQ